MNIFTAKKLTDVTQIEPRMLIKLTTKKDGNPHKSSSQWLKAEINPLYTYNDLNGLVISPITNQTENYDTLQSISITSPNNEWLLSNNHEIEFHTGQQVRDFTHEEILLGYMLRDLSLARAFQVSNHFKFDIDGFERASPNFRFSEISKIFGHETAERRQDGVHITDGTIHRPHPLKIAKFDSPRVVTLRSGDHIPITHITELGELIYDSVGLKSVNKHDLCRGYVEQLKVNYMLPKMASKLEDHLLGDTPQFRADFDEPKIKKQQPSLF